MIACPDAVNTGVPFTVKLKVGEITHASEECHFMQGNNDKGISYAQ